MVALVLLVLCSFWLHTATLCQVPIFITSKVAIMICIVGGGKCLVVRALALKSGDPGFKTRSDHWLDLILVVPGSTSQLHL